MRATARRRAHLVVVLAALAGVLAACNALIGLDGDFSLADRAADDAATPDAGSDAPSGDSGDGATDASFDGRYATCWEERTQIAAPFGPDGPRWKIPNPKGVPNVRNQAEYTVLDGSVRDEITGLEWVLEADAGAAETFDDATAHCTAVGARLPQRMELITIQDWLLIADGGGPVNPRVPMQDHDPSEADFWSGTPFRGIQGQRWVANFALAFGVAPLNRTNVAHVKCVRDVEKREAGVPNAEISLRCGLFRDLRTNLEWELVPSDLVTYSLAVGRCTALNKALDGSNTPDGWRVPTYAEALSLVDTEAAVAPAIFRALTNGAPKSGLYWTSSYADGIPSRHLAVDADDGNGSRTLEETQSAYTRCVHEIDPAFP